MIASTAWRNVWRNKKRSILSFSTIAISVIVIVQLFGIIGGFEKDLRKNSVDYVSGNIRIRHKNYSEYEHLNPLPYYVENQTLEKLEDLAIENFLSRIQVPVFMVRGDEDHRFWIEGIDFDQNEHYRDFSSLIVEGVMSQDYTGRIPPAVISSGLARKIGVSVGDQITVLAMTAYRSQKAMSFTIVGRISLPLASMNEYFLFAPLSAVQGLTLIPAGVTEILIDLDASEDLNGRLAELRSHFAGEDLDIRSWKEIGQAYNIILISKISYSIIALVFFLLGSVSIINTTIITVYERKKEIGLLAALGMRVKRIRILFFVESFFISLIGSGLGVFVGGILVAIFGVVGLNFSDQLKGVDLDVSNFLYPSIAPLVLILIGLYAVLVASVASYIPTRQVSKLSPIEALREDT